MKIALDCRSVFPGRGGIGRHTEALARWLPRVDAENQYLLLTSHRQKEPLSSSGQVTQEACPAAMIDEVWEQVQLPGILEEHGVDLYHNPCFSLPVVRTTRWRVATVHDAIFRAHPEMVDPRLRDYLDRWTGHSVDAGDAVITVSEFSKKEIVRLYGVSAEKVRVVYNGIDPKTSELPAKLPADEFLRKYGVQGKFVLYVGALEAKKNIDRLLEAYAMLRKEGTCSAMQLVLAGGRGGQDFDPEAAVRRKSLSGSVVLAGYVPDEDVPRLMRMAELFVYPSLYEGFGLPPLEAMACGTPTVVSDASCLPEVVGDAALVASAHDAEDLAEKMRVGLTNAKLRRTLGHAGRQRAAQFQWEQAARRTLDVYRSVAGATR
jgi:glycosyltransferase involved in cell wall biosynthesis